MGNFSKPPNDVLQASFDKDYVSVHFEQGVTLLDRDLNLMGDIILARMRSIIGNYIGNGVIAGSRGFAIESIKLNNNFRIASGSILFLAFEWDNPVDINYSSQPGVPSLTTPPANATRTDTVYLDVSFVEVSGAQDADLLNSGDVGLQTSVRQKATWVVRVAEDSTNVPDPIDGHVHFLLAQLVRTGGQAQITSSMITDLRKQIISLVNVEERLRLLSRPAFAASPNQFTPKSASPGNNLTLFGKNLNLGDLKVRFESINFPGTVGFADIVGRPTDTQAVVKVPFMTAGPHKLTVETSSGIDTSDDTFTLLAPPPPAPNFDPSPNQFLPKTGAVGATVTLNGNNFNVAGLTVRFGNTNATIVGTPTATRITVQVPAVPAAGAVKITVETQGGSDVSDDNFNVLATPSFDPSPNQFTPKSGGAGTSVTLLGGNFIAAGLIVRFGSVNAASVSLQSPQRIIAVVPTGVSGGVKITVVTDGGQAVSADTFTVLLIPPPPPNT